MSYAEDCAKAALAGYLSTIGPSPEDKIRQRIANDFAYHAPHGDQVERYTEIRSEACLLAMLLVDLTPVSREQSLALTHLEEAVMWANAAIARHEPSPR